MSSDQKEVMREGGIEDGAETIAPTIEGVYKFWFGKGELNSPTYVHNGKLWWKGLSETDIKIQNLFSDLVERALAGDSMFEEWKKTVKGNVALIIVLDQFTRHVFRGSAKMFAGDKQAIELAKSLIDLKLDLSVSPPEHMPLQHSENSEECHFGVEKIKELVESCTVVQRRKFNSLVTGFEKHAAIISVYGRYPHRNQLLQRISTHEEEAFLEKNSKTTKFMKSVYKKNTDEDDKENNKKGSKPKRKGIKPNPNDPKPLDKPLGKVLVLHSFRQNASIMKKRSNKLRKAFASEGIELVYVNAPLSYEAQGEDKDVVMKAFGKLPPTEHQRCFWTSKDDNNVYEGVDISIRYLADLFATQGPFLGVMAFSHGACMAAILAALQPFESVKFQFCILISGFPPRDTAHKDLFLPKTQKMPSLHILGHKDLLVDNARTRALCDAFQDSTMLEHSAGHFVPDNWPVEAMAKFSAKFLDKDNAPITKQLDHSVVLSNFISKLEATIVHGAYGESIGISTKARTVLSSDIWKSWLSSPCTISLDSVRKFVNDTMELAASPEEQNTLVEDLFVIAYAGRLNKQASKKIAADPAVLKTDELFAQVVTLLYSISSYAARLLGLMTKFCGWRDLVGIAVQAHRIAAVSTESGEKQKLETLQQEIVQLFCSQLSRDLLAISKPNGMPSSCVVGAPRIKSAPNRETKITLSVALALHPQNEKLSELAKKTKAERAYNLTIRDLTARLQEATSVDATRKQLKRTALETNYVSQFSHDLPVPVSIANPEPEPVTVAPLEELQPLFAHLKANFPVPQQISFVRGSLLPDGRLDLCKMVVGKTGIKPLLEAMEGNDAVKRLLLGNNVVGDQGAKLISDFINKGSKLTTWYIAGNVNITGDGIEPVCKALYNDPRVEQLWLKRNPLMPSGAVHLGRMLCNNSYLQVLDLVNTGMLDEGTITIMEALKQNTALKHLYLGTNGITSASCPAIRDYLKNHNRLQSLYLSLNRIGDEGAKILAEGLKENKNLERMSLASNRLTAIGVKAIAEAITSHPTLVLFDFGFTKATTTVGEIGNLMGDEGAVALASMLEKNSTLRSLDVLHNNIAQTGLNDKALRDALRTNTTLTTLNFTQFGRASNEIVKEETKLFLQRNCNLAGDALPSLQQIDYPQHIIDILSVYRTHM